MKPVRSSTGVSRTSGSSLSTILESRVGARCTIAVQPKRTAAQLEAGGLIADPKRSPNQEEPECNHGCAGKRAHAESSKFFRVAAEHNCPGDQNYNGAACSQRR